MFGCMDLLSSVMYVEFDFLARQKILRERLQKQKYKKTKSYNNEMKKLPKKVKKQKTKNINYLKEYEPLYPDEDKWKLDE